MFFLRGNSTLPHCLDYCNEAETNTLCLKHLTVKVKSSLTTLVPKTPDAQSSGDSSFTFSRIQTLLANNGKEPGPTRHKPKSAALYPYLKERFVVIPHTL